MPIPYYTARCLLDEAIEDNSDLAPLTDSEWELFSKAFCENSVSSEVIQHLENLIKNLKYCIIH